MTRVLLCLAAALLSSCGYHVAGRADLIPKKIKIIAVPAFQNSTTRYRVADRLASSITREFLARTRYQIVSKPEQADAVLNGAIVNYYTYPTIFDPASGRAAGIQVIIVLKITLTDKATGAVLYNRPSMEFRERYEISVDQRAFFEESEPAMDRLSRDVARTVVSAVLEGF